MTATILHWKTQHAEIDSQLEEAWARRRELAASAGSEADMDELAAIDRQIARAQGVGPAGRQVKAALLLALCDEDVFDRQEVTLIRTFVAAYQA